MIRRAGMLEIRRSRTSEVELGGRAFAGRKITETVGRCGGDFGVMVAA